jgi:8-oxo-dGTP diphosphatase
MKHRIRVAGIIRQSEKILLIEQENPRTGIRTWSVPGGGLEPDDLDIFAGVVREVYEETGLRVTCGPIRCISEYTSTVNNFMQVGIWIECYLRENEAPESVHLSNNRPDDYLTGVRWWSKEELFSEARVGSNLLKADFWASLEAPEGMVTYLGKKIETE